MLRIMTTADDCPDALANLADTFDIQMSAEALATITEQVRIGGTVLETGGILLGHDYENRCAVLVAGDPGPNAVRERRAFSRDRGHAERPPPSTTSTTPTSGSTTSLV
jgi:hypothetical protein